MSATVAEILELADVDRCLDETGVSSTYNHCHNACVWLILQIKQAHLIDYNINLCTGTFLGRDHSWIMVEVDSVHTVIDMTIDQFVDIPVPHVGRISDEYYISNSINLSNDIGELVDFIEKLGN